MTEQFILQFIPRRIKELDYQEYYISYADKVIEGGSIQAIQAYNSLYFIVDDPIGLRVESDYGVYDLTDNPSSDNVHQHRGEIIITNPGTDSRRIKFIKVVIVK
jgi:hypothetical protein